MANDDYFNFGPVAVAGDYSNGRGQLDGALGWLDGASSIFNSLDRTVGSITNIRENWAAGTEASDNVAFNRDRNQQDLLEDLIKVERGDNVQLYYVLGAAALAAIVILR